MSGDVQPRKRKEKRRKREDEDAGTPPPTLVGPTEDVNIHVHKEGGTGGHWCAKIIFFVLFTVLVGLVGVIIFEARGSTDVDTPVASSRWAMIFEGFVDDSVSLHEESHGKEEHEVSHEEEEEEEHDDEHDEEAEEDHDGDHEEEEDEHGGSQEVEASEEQQDEGQEEEGDDGVDNEEDAGEDEEEEDQGEDEDNEVDNEDEDEEAHLNDSGTLEEVEEEEAPSREAEQEKEDNEEDQNSQEETELLDMSVEGIDPSLQDDDDDDGNEDLPYEFFGIPGVNEIDDDAEEPLEEVDDQEIEEITNNDPLDFEPEKDEDMEEEESSVSKNEKKKPGKKTVDTNLSSKEVHEVLMITVAVKFAVGVALVVAAHFVLVRRWSDVDAELAAYNSELPADLSRRDTIISPTPLISRVQAKEPVSQQEAKVDAKNFTQHATKDITESKITSIPQRREVDLDTSESERHSGTEEDINYDSEEEEEDEEDEEEDDIVELDDTELVAKLEAKYGKIPTPSQSEEEATGDDDEELDDEEDLEDEEDEDEEDEESEEEESGEHYDWKHVRAPKTHSGPQPTEHESRSREPRGRSGGKQEHRDFYNTSEVDEAVMQEELENWLMRDFDN